MKGRVLIAERGPMASYLDASLRAAGLETVVVFSEEEQDHPRLDEASYAAFVAEDAPVTAYVDAANDAGCEMIHPGPGPLAEDAAFALEVASANLLFIGPPFDRLAMLADRWTSREAARRAGVAPPFSTGVLTGPEPLVRQAGALGLPIWIKDRHGLGADRAESVEDAVATVNRRLSRGQQVWAEAHVRDARHLVVSVAADRHGHTVALGVRERALRRGRRLVADQLPASVTPGLARALEDAAETIARTVGFQGVGSVGYLTDPSGAAWCLGLRPRLDLGSLLNDQVYGLRLPELQLRLARGEAIGWGRDALEANGVALGVRIRALGEGTLTRLEVPDEVQLVGTAAVGQLARGLVGVMVVQAPTRQACLVRAVHALGALRVEGVQTDVAEHLELLAAPDFWGRPGA